MPDTINVLGHPVNKKVAIIGGIGTVGAIAVIVIRRRSADASTATSATTGTAAADADTATVTDPAGNVCAAVDPVSGYCPGSPEDQSAQESSASALEDEGIGDEEDGDLGEEGIEPTVPTTGTLSTREEWIEQAESDLNAPSLGGIAANVFAGIAVSAADKDVFLQAVAIEGQPPGGYPSPIKTTDTKGAPGPGKSSSVTVPKVTGWDLTNARARLAASGLKSSVDKTFHPKTVIESQEPAAGSKAQKGSVVKLTGKKG
jgi:hypothetical protein